MDDFGTQKKGQAFYRRERARLSCCAKLRSLAWL